jgi:hypothetical protein
VRSRVSLDGVWAARLDPDDCGLAEGWHAPDTPFDRELPVPMAWQAADGELRQYAGVMWYRRTFDLPPEGLAVAAPALRFGAVDYRARVWVNGREVGGHEGGYTPFELEIDQAVRSGQNTLTLRVEDPADLSEIPHGKQGGRWYTASSGPWQSVWLLSRPRDRVLDVRIHPDAARGAAGVRVRCLVSEELGPVRLTLAAFDGASEVAVAAASALVSHAEASAWCRLEFPAARLWEPDAPHLYRLRVTLSRDDGTEIDACEERFGLRSFEARDGRLYLNGKPFYVRGALDQAFWPNTLYTPPSDDEIEREIRLAREMGLNLLRKHIKPEDPRYLDAADRLGMLIWAEPPNPDRFTPTARAALRRDLFEMVERDFNHPSVVVWSLYNEDWGVPNLWSDRGAQEWVAGLYRELRALDPTRPICDNSGWAHVVTDLNDYHEYYAAPDRIERFRERLDFVRRHPEDNFASGWSPRGEPILVSEWGNWGLPDPALGRERSGGQDPYWYRYDRAYARPSSWPPALVEDSPVERMKTIAGFEERFRGLGLDRIFESPAALCVHLQRRAFRSLKAQLEEMRRRPEIVGHVVTELTDVEWEANGWLDYWRQPKSWHGDLALINEQIALIPIAERPNVWGGDPVVVELHVQNTTDRPIRGRVRWRLETSNLGGELSAEVGPFATARLPDAIRFRAPGGQARAARLDLELVEDARVVTRGYAELAFAPRAAGVVDGLRLAVTGFERVFRQRLERQGYRVRGAAGEPSVGIASRLDEPVWSFLQGGGRVLYLAGASDETASRAGLRFAPLPPGESWRMAAGAAWARVDRLAPVPLLPELGWEVSGIFPHQAIDAASLRPGDETLVGWIEGWLANPGAFALRRAEGRGRLLATTFRFEDAYGVDPVATLLLNRLVELLLEA